MKSKTARIFLIVAVAFLASSVLIFLVLSEYSRSAAFKSWLEMKSSRALGMELQIHGELRIGLFPGPSLVMRDVELHNRGTQLGSADEVRLRVALLPLLVKRVDVTAMVLDHPRIFIQRGSDGILNLIRSTPPLRRRPHGPMEITARGGTVRYRFATSDQVVEAEGCDADLHDVRTGPPGEMRLLERVSFHGDMACKTAQVQRLAVTDLHIQGTATMGGAMDLTHITMQLLGGEATASLQADLSGDRERYALHASVTRVDVSRLISVVSPKQIAKGNADASAELSFEGRDREAISRSLSGRVSVQGADGVLEGYDLDSELSHFEKSQRFDLTDLAAGIVAGPWGIAASKGSDFYRIKQKGGSSAVHKLAADWRLTQGIASAEDVAMSTDRHRVALQGKLDLAHQSFDGVTVATVDAKGCVIEKEQVSGGFAHPKPEKANVLRVLTGPIRNLITKAETHPACAVFYSGSVPPY